MDTMLLVVTALAVTMALVSTTIAWRVTQADRRRRAARVTALAAAAGVADRVLPEFTAPAAATEPATPEPAATVAEPGSIALGSRFLAGDTAGSGSSSRQHWLLAAATFAAVLVVTAGVVSLVGARRPAADTAAAVAPLELVALAHNRADGVLTVSGLVRNPAAGARVDKLEAEVRVFDPSGILIATRTSLVDYLELGPGQESPFVVALGAATTAARYRVSFRTAGTMRPHVDQRTNLPASVDRTAVAR